MRGLILLTLALFTAACAGNPYVMTKVDEDAEAAAKRRLFHYGHFCGAGNPEQTAEVGDVAPRIAVLASQWPPVDELDALCYGHDLCYEQRGHDDRECDKAFSDALDTYYRKFQGPHRGGCRNLASDMEAAFHYKGVSGLARLGMEIGSVVEGAQRDDYGVVIGGDRKGIGRTGARNVIGAYPEHPGFCSASPDIHDFDAALQVFSTSKVKINALSPAMMEPVAAEAPAEEPGEGAETPET